MPLTGGVADRVTELSAAGDGPTIANIIRCSVLSLESSCD